MATRGTGAASRSARPTIFISCVSAEFRTIRAKVAESLRFLGYDVEYQEGFPTDAGDLRDLLRQKIDAAEGVIQLVGDAYGEEPPVEDPEFGRVSYTQFELLYARSTGKRTWLLFAGAQSTRDTPSDQLDLPDSADEAERRAYQMERRELQKRYRETLQDGNLRFNFGDDNDLEKIVLRMRRDLDELKESYRQWQAQLQSGQHLIGRRLRWVAGGLVVVALLVAGGVVWLRSAFDVSDLAQKTSMSQVTRDDVYFDVQVMLFESAGQPNQFVLAVGPAKEDVEYLFRNAEFAFSIDGAEFTQAPRVPLGHNVAEHHAFKIEPATQPETIAVLITGTGGDTAGPFEFDPDIEAKVQEQRDLMGSMMPKHLKSVRTKDIARVNAVNALSCSTYSWASQLSVCAVSDRSSVRELLEDVDEIVLGTHAQNLQWRLRPGAGPAIQDLPVTRSYRNSRLAYLVPASAGDLHFRLTYDDGEQSEVFKIAASYNRDAYELFELIRVDRAAPRVFLQSFGFNFGTGGQWSMVPLVGDEMAQVSWTLFEGGASPFERHDGFFNSGQVKGDELGATAHLSGRESPEIRVTFTAPDGGEQVHLYRAHWQDWTRRLVLSDLDYRNMLSCSTARGGVSWGKPLVSVWCNLDAPHPVGQIFTSLEWGAAPDDLAERDLPAQVQPLLGRYDAQAEIRLEERAASGAQKHELDRERNMIASQRTMMQRSLERDLVSWDSLAGQRRGVVAAATEPADALYFRFTLVDGTSTPVIRVPVR